MRTKTIAIIAIALTVLLVWQHDALLRAQFRPDVAPKPERQVLRVWVCEGWVGSTTWLEKQCAVFERAHPGVNLRIRRAQADEWIALDAVLPDVLVFTPGVLTEPEALLTPIHGATPVRAELVASGKWRDELWGLPVAMGGYALLVNPEGYRDPEATALDAEAMAAAAKPAKGKQAARYALQCARGSALAYPAGLLALGGALRGGWPQGIAAERGKGALPEDFTQCTQEKAYSDFVSRRAMALLGTQRDVRKFSALTEAGKGFPFRVEPAVQAFTDQLLLVGVLKNAQEGERAALCAQLLWQLVGEDAQQSLTEHGLFPVRGDVPGYDAEATPWLHAMAQSLAAEEIWVPNAFAWAEQRAAFLSRVEMALAQGGVDLISSGVW